MARLNPFDRTVQPIRVPDRQKNPAAVYSSLELVKLPKPEIVKGFTAGMKSEWIIIHWIENEIFQKLQPWETFAIRKIGCSVDDARATYAGKKEIWSARGFFCIAEWASLNEGRRLRSLAKQKPAPKEIATTPKSLYEEKLKTATLEHLRPVAPNTMAAKLAGKEKLAAFYFEHESDLPHEQPDLVNGAIVRELRRAFQNNALPPSDKQLSEIVKQTLNLKVSPEAIKKRRHELGIPAMARGPKPNPGG
jgi:hypothetical protein